MKRYIHSSTDVKDNDLEFIKIRMYGDFLCSCGCGTPLGNPSVYLSDNDICPGVGLKTDEEGYEWRLFTPECWDRLNLDNEPLSYIYNSYPAAPSAR